MVANAIVLLDEQTAVQSVQTLYNIVLTLRQDVLKNGVDYGIIPGTGDKPTLLLPGMEKLMRALNTVPEYIERQVICDYDRPLFHYHYECRLIDVNTGVAIPGGRGLGLCTSFESSFRWRQAHRVCPQCGEDAIIKGKAEYGGGWLCFTKKGGCGAKFPDGDPSIEGQAVGRVENSDIFDQVNAIMKRAKKRALGDAIKGAAAISEFFTVDLEDFTRFDISTPGNIIEAEFTEVPDEPAKPANSKPKDETPPHWVTVNGNAQRVQDETGMSAGLGAKLIGLKSAVEFAASIEEFITAVNLTKAKNTQTKDDATGQDIPATINGMSDDNPFKPQAEKAQTDKKTRTRMSDAPADAPDPKADAPNPS